VSQTPPRPHRILIAGDSDSAGVLALADALPPDGRMICIEGDRAAAARAARRFADRGLSDRVSVMVGDPALFVRKVAGPFDLIVIAADGTARDRIAAHLPRLSAPGARVELGWPGGGGRPA
jgi:predicted O-methyltransferase YrrM